MQILLWLEALVSATKRSAVTLYAYDTR